jgi:STE24 endopeptidase
LTPQTLFYIIVAVIILDFIVDKILDSLNAKHFDDPIPPELEDVYDEKEYKRSQDYKKSDTGLVL